MTPREAGALLAAGRRPTPQQIEAAARILAAVDVEPDERAA